MTGEDDMDFFGMAADYADGTLDEIFQDAQFGEADCATQNPPYEEDEETGVVRAKIVEEPYEEQAEEIIRHVEAEGVGMDEIPRSPEPTNAPAPPARERSSGRNPPRAARRSRARPPAKNTRDASPAPAPAKKAAPPSEPRAATPPRPLAKVSLPPRVHSPPAWEKEPTAVPVTVTDSEPSERSEGSKRKRVVDDEDDAPAAPEPAPTPAKRSVPERAEPAQTRPTYRDLKIDLRTYVFGWLARMERPPAGLSSADAKTVANMRACAMMLGGFDERVVAPTQAEIDSVIDPVYGPAARALLAWDGRAATRVAVPAEPLASALRNATYPVVALFLSRALPEEWFVVPRGLEESMTPRDANVLKLFRERLLEQEQIVSQTPAE